MEEIIYSDLYYIIYNVLAEVCEKIMSKEEDIEKDLDIETIDDLVDMEDDEIEEHDDFNEEEFDDLDEDYQEEVEERQDDSATELLQFLTGENPEYDSIFEKVGKQMEYPFIQDYILYKHIMMLIVTSVAYCEISYDISRGIAEDDELIELYEGIIDNPASIYPIFEDKNNYDIAKALVNCYLDYFCCEQYIRNTLSLQLIKDTGKLPKLLRMNPFEIFSYLNCYSVDELTKSEITIQNFRDAYDYILSYSSDMELDEKDRMELFLQKLDEYYQHDSSKLNQAIAYMFSNIYENLRLYPNDELNQQFLSLIEDSCETLDDLIETYKNDVDFFWTMTDYFYGFNHDLNPDDLALLRWNFKTGKGNVKVLKKLNSFYDDEEEMFSTSYFSTNE